MKNDTTQEDALLMRRVRDGRDRMAFHALLTRYRQPAFGVAYRYLLDYQEAEDALQDAFLKLWDRAGQWDEAKGSVKSWFYRVLLNECCDRQRRKRRAVHVEIPETLAEENDGLDSAEESELQRALQDALKKLGERQRKALILSYFEGMSHTEIAAMIGGSAKSIESLLARARAALKTDLAPWGKALEQEPKRGHHERHDGRLAVAPRA